MKKNILKVLMGAVLALVVMASCSELDVDVKSEFVEENFPTTPEDFEALSGGVYNELKHELFILWFCLECSGDAMMLPANNGGGWFDGGRYRDLHMHTWPTDHQFITRAWNKFFAGITQCNITLDAYKNAEDNDVKTRAVAEMRGMRAYYYYMLMDMFGGVPIINEFGEIVETRNTRKETYEFIESELLEIMDDLSSASDKSTYSKVNKWTAYALLAKMSLNAPVYIGENRANDVVKYCDAVINEATTNGTFELTDDYMSVFHYQNGPEIKDIIFAIPFDGWFDTNNNYALFFARYWMTKPFQNAWGIKKGSGPMRAQPVFYDLFTEDQNDERNAQWLTGPQYDLEGNPIIMELTYEELDAVKYAGTELAARDTAWHIEFTKEVNIPNTESWQLIAKDQVRQHEGYRSVKFFPDVNNSVPDRRQSNDFPIFRYADILLMKAEAITLQGASSSDDALSLVNAVRARSSASLFTADEIDSEEEFLAERGREFAFENWRRNDMIRLGAFESSYTFKTDDNLKKRLFPIPQEAIEANPLLNQNPGYN